MVAIVTHVSVYVRNYDEALKWYTETLGLEKRADEEFGPGMRWLTVAPKDQKELELVLHVPYGETKSETEEMRAMIGKSTHGLVFQSTNCIEDCARLRSRGVNIVREPEQVPWGTQAIFEDLYGNRFVMVESKADQEH